MLSYNISSHSTLTQLTLNGDLDFESTELIERGVLPQLLNLGKPVDINMKDVPFVDSSGIGILINMIDDLKDKGLSISVNDVRQEVYDVLNMMQVPDIIGVPLSVMNS